MAGLLDAVIKSIRAFHGSPHNFDRFDISRIGTGEGAATYGHGLYFAGNEAVAKSYRDALSGLPTSGGVDVFHDAPWANRFTKQWAAEALDKAAKGGASGDEAVRAAIGDLTKRGNLSSTTRLRQQYYDAANGMGQLIGKPWEINPGHMYEVNIHAQPSQLLDWDKPLSAQPRIADALVDAFPNPKLERRRMEQWRAPSWSDAPPDASYLDTVAGSTKYNALASELGSYAKASDALRERGVPGIQYLDQGSRAPGGLDRTQLQNSIDVLRGDIGRLEQTGGGNLPRLREKLSSYEGALSAMPQPTSNYVMFNDNLVDIARKYSVPGMLGMTGGGFAQNFAPYFPQQQAQ